MGKDLKGKELGKGVCQRKDGLYSARCTQHGQSFGSYFKTVKEAKAWLKELDRKPKRKRGMTVDQWYDYWMTNLISDLAPNTRRNYAERYHYNVGPYIGDIYLTELKPMHCKQVLNRMEPQYATSSIVQTYITMGTLFKAALNNDLIDKHPLTGIKVNKPRKAPDDIHFLTIDEQTRFLEAAKRSHNYRQYALILETGLRTGELDGSAGLASRGTDILRVNASKIADRTAEIAIQRKPLSDYISMVEQAAVCADPELYSYILKAVTEGTTFVVLKSLYGIPCERDMFYDRRRKFYWALSGVR